MFNSLFIQTDVTCVEFFKSYIAAGIGGYLHIYSLAEKLLLSRLPLFSGEKIFGIKPNSTFSQLIVYGGKHIALVSLSSDCIHNQINHSWILSDWILDAKWIENNQKIACMFMHNNIKIWLKHFTKLNMVKCEERCILYSAHICYDTYEQLMVLSGTVFSEILVWKPSDAIDNGVAPVLRRLKQHKGVIFSIHFELDNGLICSASDDRSAILWKVTDSSINMCCQVYGHLSRVFRCLILGDCFITAGEDSLLIIWSFDGTMIRKIVAHQGGPIWSLCYDPGRDLICSGGNDGAISLYKAKFDVMKLKMTLPESCKPKIVSILNSGAIAVLSETGVLYYHRNLFWQKVNTHSDLQKYSKMDISPCKKLIGLCGYEGQMYIYKEEGDLLNLIFQGTLKLKTRIYSFHWLDCKTFLASQKDGFVNMFFMHNHQIQCIHNFILPPVKERWPTTACRLKNHIVIGDRKGNVHNFKVGNENPINSIKKAHSYLGVTKLYVQKMQIVSLGKDGVIKTYRLMENGWLECVNSNKTKFSWLTALFDKNYVLSFSGDNFVISDMKFHRVLFEVPCGGGHRSWDFSITTNNFTFTFIKQKNVSVLTLDLEQCVPNDIKEGFHVKEINAIQLFGDNHYEIIISGGEDTALRLSRITGNEIEVLYNFKVHLSSIRAISYFESTKEREFLLVTGGGRAQIVLWCLKIDMGNITCQDMFNLYEPLDKVVGETRIMDLAIETFRTHLLLFAGCSDGYIKIFFILDRKTLEFKKRVLHSHYSVTKLMRVPGYIASMATDGFIKFWPLEKILSSDCCENLFKIHQSAVTSCSSISQGEKLFVLTGGDDNSITLSCFVVDKTFVTKIFMLSDTGFHCAQITGTYLMEEYFMTSSIDQKIIMFKWSSQNQMLQFEQVGRYDTSIADAQGIVVKRNEDDLSVFVFGNGVEKLKVKIRRQLANIL